MHEVPQARRPEGADRERQEGDLRGRARRARRTTIDRRWSVGSKKTTAVLLARRRSTDPPPDRGESPAWQSAGSASRRPAIHRLLPTIYRLREAERARWRDDSARSWSTWATSTRRPSGRCWRSRSAPAPSCSARWRCAWALVKEDQVLKALGEQLGMKVVKLADVTIPAELTELVNERWRRPTRSCRSRRTRRTRASRWRWPSRRTPRRWTA